MKLLVTRPSLDAAPLAQALRDKGHEVVIAPLLEIVPRKSVAIPRLAFKAICVTSANGIRVLDQTLPLDWPVFAVGAQSAAAAKAKGFTHVEAQGGDVDRLTAYIAKKLRPADGPLLYISGAETSGDLEGQLKDSGFEVHRAVTYDAVAQKLDAIAHEIPSSDGVLLYSPRTAKLWTNELARLNLAIPDAHLLHFCLSAQVAAQLPQHWPARVATRPTDAALLSLLDLASKHH